jgi:integrase
MRHYWGNWYSCLKHLERYCTEKTTFKDITTDWIDGFKDYLDNVAKDAYKRKNNDLAEAKPLSQNSKVSYFNKLRACINQAFEERIIPVNPLRGVSGFKNEETERTYLTFDEVKKMAQTACKYPALKRAFLFSCLTGLRKSDIEKMIWGEVQKMGDQTRIVFKQKKTGGQEYLDINTQAETYLGERRNNTDRVFAGFKYNSQTLLELRRWALMSGITKDLTFHTGRHTFAVIMLDLGVEIYTVSKLLGHKDLSTTQIYAKVLDKKKQDAVNLIPNINE